MPADPLPEPLAAGLGADAARVCEAAREQALAVVQAELAERYAAALRQRLSGAAAPPAPAPEAPHGGGNGCYVYAVVPADCTLPGTDILRTPQVAALVGEVDVAQLRAASEAADLDPEGWLVTAVQEHDAVVDRAFRAGPVLPLRFGTVLDDTAALRRVLEQRGDTLRRELDRIGGCAEWGVKLVATPVEEAPAEPVTGGRDYLAARRARRDAARHAQRGLDELAAEVHDLLAGAGRDAVTGPLRWAGEERPVVLNASYLVADCDAFEAAWQRLQPRLADAGVAAERTGPWPAYHFVSVELGA